MEQCNPQFERTLAYHCAPAMAGIKSADLISWDGRAQDFPALVEAYDRVLAGRGIRLRLLCTCKRRCLVLVYRPECLTRQLSLPGVRRMLGEEGYPTEGGLESQLDELRARLSGGAFPHEVGLFLGYPPEDVEGFCRHQGRNFKLCGCWKVYSNVEHAKQRFHRYHCCRKALCRRVEAGTPLARLFRAA